MPIFVENELSKADSLIKVGELAEAEEIYKKVLSEFPNDKKAIQGCQELKAEIDSNRALKSEPPQEQVQELINIYTTEQHSPGRMAVALVQAEMLTQQYPNSFVAWSILGFTSQGVGRGADAVKAFDKVTELNPNYSDGLNNLGTVLKTQGSLEEALGVFIKLRTLKPGSLSTHKKILSLEFQIKALHINPLFTDLSLEYFKSHKNQKTTNQMFANFPDSEDSFFVSIVSEVIKALDENQFNNNFDTERFNYDGNDHSKDWHHQEYLFFFNWLVKNHSSLFGVFLALEDKRSKELFLHLLVYRMGSHFTVKLPLKFCEGNSEHDYLKLEYSSASDLKIKGFIGTLRHYKFVFDNKQYCVDCLGLKYYLQRKQYFLSRNTTSVQPETGDYVVDGGACWGDTTAVFSNAVGGKGMVYSFDPLSDHIEILNYNIAQFPIKNVKIMPFGLANENVNAEPIRLNSYDPAFNIANKVVPLRKIDTLVDNEEIQRIDFIKLDVEGFEMQVLLGANIAINKFKPKLAVSLYHKPDDMFEILAYIRKHHPFYKFHLGHYTIHSEETVLYCDPIVR
jgi:FkbM family methyltransferase